MDPRGEQARAIQRAFDRGGGIVVEAVREAHQLPQWRPGRPVRSAGRRSDAGGASSRSAAIASRSPVSRASSSAGPWSRCLSCSPPVIRAVVRSRVSVLNISVRVGASGSPIRSSAPASVSTWPAVTTAYGSSLLHRPAQERSFPATSARAAPGVHRPRGRPARGPPATAGPCRARSPRPDGPVPRRGPADMGADLADVIAARRGPRLRRDRQILTGIRRFEPSRLMPELIGGLGQAARRAGRRPGRPRPAGPRHELGLDGQVVDIGPGAGQPGLFGRQLPFFLLELAVPERELLVVLVRVQVLQREQACLARLDAGLRVGFRSPPSAVPAVRPGDLRAAVPIAAEVPGRRRPGRSPGRLRAACGREGRRRTGRERRAPPCPRRLGRRTAFGRRPGSRSPWPPA